MPEEPNKKIINDLYACVDENDNQSYNCGNYKISVFMTPKTVITEDAMFKDVLKLEYNKDIKCIVLEDDLYSIGLKGYIEIYNTGSWLDKIINRINQLYIVINITEYENINGELKPYVKYEPYIFDLSYAENISSSDSQNKILRLGLMDCVTSIIEQHSIANVIQFNRNITTATSYKRVFQYIHEYIKDHINTNLNNKFEWKKDLLYDDTCSFLTGNTSGNDTNTYMSWLVSETFGKISKDATIAEALQVIYVDACTTMFAPSRFNDVYQNIGNVLIPFYFKEEYPDRYFLYPNLWKNGYQNETSSTTSSSNDSETATDTTSSNVDTTTTATDTTTTVGATTQPGQNTQQQNQDDESSWTDTLRNVADRIRSNNADNESSLYNKTYGGKADHLLYRQMTMRDIYMPFLLAFGPEKNGCVFEVINPQENTESNFSINGILKEEIHDIQYDPVRIKDLKKLWKNVIFIACDSSNTGGDSTLIFFSWFYDYFTNVFLNESVDEGVIRKRFACACPAFHKMMINEGITHGSSTTVNDKGFVNKVDEHNAYVYATKTKDTVNECMRVMGKNIASFVLANDTYTFTLRGNLRRRPNEIIKFGFTPDGIERAIRPLTISTGLFDNNHLYLYVQSVTHNFSGNVYTNTLRTNKFMEEVNNF